MKATPISIVALAATVMTFSLGPSNLQAGENTPSVTAILSKYAQASQLSPALEEIVKLSKAGVGEPVTLAYIQASPIPYSLDAQDIVRLREQGVTAPVVTAMMQHGDELRRASAESTKQAQTVASVAATAPIVTTPTPASVTYVSAPSSESSSVSVTYFGTRNSDCYYGYPYTYGVGYPTYYSYTPRYYGYGYCGPRVGFGFGYGGVHAGYARGYYAGYGRHH